jgi:hypothetical protein
LQGDFEKANEALKHTILSLLTLVLALLVGRGANDNSEK